MEGLTQRMNGDDGTTPCQLQLLLEPSERLPLPKIMFFELGTVSAPCS